MSELKNILEPKLVEDATRTANALLQSNGDLEFDCVSSCSVALGLLLNDVKAVCQSITCSGKAVVTKALSNMLRALMPLADIIAKAKSKLEDATFFDFISPCSLFRAHTGICKFTYLLSAADICLKVVALALEHYTQYKIDYVAQTRVKKEELLKMIGCVEFPIKLLTHDGIVALGARLFEPGNEFKPQMVACASAFCILIGSTSFSTVKKALDLMRNYEKLRDIASVRELRTLSRPPSLTEAHLIKSALHLSRLNNMAFTTPVPCSTDDQVNRYMDFIATVESCGIDNIASSFWTGQMKDDLFSKPFLLFLESWKEIRSHPGDLAKGIEYNLPKLCMALIQRFNSTPLEQFNSSSSDLITMSTLASHEASEIMERMALEMLDFSKTSSTLSEEERINNCVAGATLMAFRVFILGKCFAVHPEKIRLPVPNELFDAFVPLSQAWIECGHCFVANESDCDFRYALAFVAHSALEVTGRVVLPRLIKEIGTSTMNEEEVTSMFAAQTAISTLIATAACTFATYSQGDDGYIETKKVLFDIIPEASRVNCLLCDLMSLEVSFDNCIRTVSVCEAGLKAVEAASKALFWGWGLSLRQILEVGSQCSDSLVPNYSIDMLCEKETYFAPDLHRAVYHALKATLYSCPFYGNTPGDPSSELARKVGAVALKAFHAMEIEPHNDWLQVLGMQLPVVRSNSYLSMPGILLDPSANVPYERINTVFETAILPILAQNEPWLENAVNDSSDFGLCKQTLKDAMKTVVEGGEVHKKRAAARAHAMATLHCGYVGCMSITLPNVKGKLCSGCKVVRYCSEKCLKADWKKNHRIACKAIAAGAENKSGICLHSVC